ncbi:dihydrodipicolinate synthase, partial [Limnospira maxima CS-328]
MVTPFWEDGSINYAEAERLAAHLAANGSDTLVVCGTTGESPTLTWDEEHELFKVVQQAVAGKAKVIAGTGSNSTQEAIAATQKAAKLGVDGSLQVVPYYNKPPQEGLYQHFLAIASACADLPIVLYNIPGRTGQNLQPETVARLASVPNIVAIKEASGSLDQASQIRQLTPKEFQIYSGDDSLTLPLLAVGGTGVVSVASHLVGKQIQDMIQMLKRVGCRKQR